MEWYHCSGIVKIKKIEETVSYNLDNSFVERVDDPAMYLSLYGDIVFVCKSYYFECLIKELGINSNTSSNTTYKPTSFDKDEILANHRSFMTSLNIPSGKESEDLPYLYWILKLHKTPYKERYIAGSSTCLFTGLYVVLLEVLLFMPILQT
jgi:hypothetical protein